jgi:hypothetical protein
LSAHATPRRRRGQGRLVDGRSALQAGAPLGNKRAKKRSRRPDILWYTVNRLTRKTGTGLLVPCPIHGGTTNSRPGAGASKGLHDGTRTEARQAGCAP